MNPQPLFFGWNTPWLPRLATYLLSVWNAGGQGPREDLSTTVVIVPGRRAGRRLLELLALEAEREKVSLIPPRIVTLREAVRVLLIPPARIFHADRDEEAAKPGRARQANILTQDCMSTYCPSQNVSLTQHPSVFPDSAVDQHEISGLEGGLLSEAGEWTCRLAWREALLQLPEHLLACIQPLPQAIPLHHSGEYLLGLVATLAQELGEVGLDFKTVAARVGGLFPETAEREEPRWQALAQLEDGYRDLLASWGYCAPDDFLRICLEHGVVTHGLRVLAVGVVDSTSLLKSFFEKINSAVIVIAPEEHAPGFTQHGALVPQYWLEHFACIQDAQLISCERNEDQVAEVVRLTLPLEDPAEKVAIAVPDVTTLPLLQDRLKQYGMETRRAAGLPFRGGRLYQLLEAMADFLDHKKNEGPSLQALGALVRHPDIQSHCSDPEEFLRQLDALEREHLPAFIDKASLALFKKNSPLLLWIEELEKLISVDPGLLPLGECASQLRALLLRILARIFHADLLRKPGRLMDAALDSHFDLPHQASRLPRHDQYEISGLGKGEVRSDRSEGHYFLGSLEECLQVLEETEEIGSRVLSLFSMRDFIKNLLDLLGEKKIPEREEPTALELLGWLEMSADDAPYAIITSCYEGSLPSNPASNPLLPERLRKIFGLNEESTLLARDHYLLQSIVASRDTILIAPRYNGGGEPVRPSRLLMLGTSLEKLSERVLRLTQHRTQKEKKERSAFHASRFCARPVEEERVTRVTVTGLRTYLQSPRLFYLQHVLKLRELEEVPLEMHAGHFGTLIHAVLGAFGRDQNSIQEYDVLKIRAWLRRKLFHLARLHFAPGPTFPIHLQLEEAAETLDGFALAQVAHYRQGWRIIACEQSEKALSQPLEKKIIVQDGRSMLLQGRIDRIDWHPELQRWMIIDYKTRHDQDWKKATPNREHFQKKGEEIFWKDLQLPLYLKLASHWELLQKSGLPLPTLETTDLCYFQLPIEAEKAGLSEPLDPNMVVPAWEEARRLMTGILDGNFEALGDIDAKRMPTLAALCGVSMLS